MDAGKKIRDAYQTLHFTQEYKLLYCPWTTLYNAEVEIAFVSPNPSNKMHDGGPHLKVISGGTIIVHLPHLLRHEIFFRAECHEP